MTKAVTLILPHQLYKNHPAVSPNRSVVMVEEYLLFNQFSFHKQKLVLHRASMQFYEDYLKKQKVNVDYREAKNDNNVEEVIAQLADKKVEELHYTDPVDDWLQRRITKACREHAIKEVTYSSPNFLTPVIEADAYFASRAKYFQTDFYNWQRQKLNILMTTAGEPEGGKWSFDYENREAIKKNVPIPQVDLVKENKWVKEARNYVDENFGNNYGELTDPDRATHGFYPVTFKEAEDWLDQFLQERFYLFGKYEDAIVANQHFLFHSVLTPMLNIGLLLPGQVLDRVLQAAQQYNIPINSVEGYIRQIIGWREFIKIVYTREGRRQRTKNYWGFTRKIPPSFWQGTTGVVPVDNVIGKLLKCAYTHHIERLMVMGNFMLLCEFDPDDVYKWFMEMYIDSYDWVMVPNTYGMTQFADGGLMTTKPYISSSNYLMKMGNYQKGDWQQVWDGLFWRFMHVHRDLLARNMRLGMLIKTFDKMSPDKQAAHIAAAENYLQSLDAQ